MRTRNSFKCCRCGKWTLLKYVSTEPGTCRECLTVDRVKRGLVVVWLAVLAVFFGALFFCLLTGRVE